MRLKKFLKLLKKKFVKSTKDEIQLESCNKCHSFYTGKFKTVKTGNVQKFKDKYGITD